jgi:hypothetical protein
MLVTDLEDKIRCPRCGGPDVRHSVSRGIADAFLAMLGRHPFRCRACKCRFHKSGLRKSRGRPVDGPVGPGDSKAV